MEHAAAPPAILRGDEMATEVEIEAAKAYLDEASRLVRRDQPVPAIIIAGMLEAAERVRANASQTGCGGDVI